MTIIYIDTSALVKRVVVEQESADVRRMLRETNAAGDVVAVSELAWLEVWRTLRRASVDDLESAATAALRGIAEIPLTTDILVRAWRIGPATLRSLDAIHLTSAVAIGATTVVTYDDRMARAAADFGFDVIRAAHNRGSLLDTPRMSEAPSRWSRATAEPDMWIDPDDDPREEQSSGTDERSILIDYLRRYRLTMQMKCADLDAEQLARRSVPPSTMSLLGLVRHIAEVERNWFRRVMAREPAPPLYYTKESPDDDWDGARADEALVAGAWQAWRDEVSFAEQYVNRIEDLGTMGSHHGDAVPLRDVLVHMIEEYARHSGHADLLRECIDGRVGQ